MAINYRDPRFQRAMLRTAASNPYKAVQDYGGLTSNFVTNQMGTQMEFNRLGEAKRQHKENLAFANKQLRQNVRMFNKQDRLARDDLYMGAIGGLATSGLAGYLGRERRLDEAKLAAANREFLENQMALTKKHNAYMDRLLGLASANLGGTY